MMIGRLSLLLLTGCMANNSLGTYTESQNNIWGLSRLSVGMTESQVLQIMHHPYYKKTIKSEANSYDVWFYVTRQTALNQSRLVRQNLTPLTFENGVLQGWGYDYYRYVLNETSPHPVKKSGNERPDSLQKTIENFEEDSAPSSRPIETSQNQAVDKSSEKKKQKNEDEEESEEEKPDEKSRDMIRDENEQNFDFW